MKIVKFGGSSLATGTQISKVTKIIQSDPQRRVIVVSAPGKRFKKDIKITDLLLQLAQAVIDQQETADIYKQIFLRYAEIADFFKLPKEVMQDLKKTSAFNRSWQLPL